MADTREIRTARLQDLKRQLMAMVDATTVPSGILAAPPQSPALDRARGIPSDPPLNRQGWREVYFNLHRGGLSAAASLPPLASIEDRAKQVRQTGAIPLAIAHYRYHAPNDMFVNRMRHYVEQGGAPPAASRDKPEAVLEQRNAFFAAPLLEPEYNLFTPAEPVHRGLAARFVVPSSLYLSNTGQPPTQIEVDPGDGKGYRKVALDQPFDTTYASPGTKQIRVRASTGGEALECSADMQTVAAAAPPFQEYWKLTSTIRYENTTPTGHAWVYYGQGHAAIENPLIVAEGFPGGYCLDKLWSVLNAQGFATNILKKGYDLIILGFDEGTSYIEANAGVAIAAIQKAIGERQGSTPLVVGGASMGGLITRYALTYMEANYMDHQTRLYFSFDSPHLGALVPASAMYFASYYALVSDAASQANEKLTSPAAQEMLIYSLASYSTTPVAPSALRTTMVGNLRNLGNMPKKCRNIGVANGTGNGAGNGAPPSVEILTFPGQCASGSLYSAPGVNHDSSPNLIAQLSFVGETDYYCWSYPATDACAFDGVPGGTNDFMGQLASGLKCGGFSPSDPYPSSCFMPSITACALYDLSLYNNGDLYYNISQGNQASLLDAYLYSDQNYPHVTVTPAIADWLMQELGAPAGTAAAAAGR